MPEQFPVPLCVSRGPPRNAKRNAGEPVPLFFVLLLEKLRSGRLTPSCWCGMMAMGGGGPIAEAASKSTHGVVLSITVTGEFRSGGYGHEAGETTLAFTHGLLDH